jgi:UDP-GlcNAc:undecaprenyl-phosphate GlcNAc-1-phosphate transferase
MTALDRPDARKKHAGEVPRLGGAALLLGFAAGVGLALWWEGYQGSLFNASRFHWIGWIAGIGVLFLCGLADDLRGMRPAIKLAFQLAAGLGVFLAGFRIDVLRFPSGDPIPLGVLALPATLLWIVGVTNAINLIDGLDGLAAGIGFLIAATIAAVSSYVDVFPVTVISLALAGSLLGFLPYNFSPARIFMGDSGSQFLGFTFAVISIRSPQKSATVVAILVPILMLGLPILDTLLVILRRAWGIRTDRLAAAAPGTGPAARGLRAHVASAGRLFVADREHIHHNLVELGLSDRKAVLVLYVGAALFCTAAFCLVALHDPTLAILIASCAAVALVAVKVFAVRRRGYVRPGIVASFPMDERQESEDRRAPAAIRAPGDRPEGREDAVGGERC